MFDYKGRSHMNNTKYFCGEVSCGMVANMLNSNIAKSKFEVQLCYCIYFLTDIFGKGMNPLISRPSWLGLQNTPTTSLLRCKTPPRGYDT